MRFNFFLALFFCFSYCGFALADFPECQLEGTGNSIVTPYRYCARLSEHKNGKDFNQSEYISGAVAIDTSRIECTAPCGAHFTAKVNGKAFNIDDTFQDISYHWDFGDEWSIFHVLGQDFRFGNSANYAQGMYSAHVFRNPGRYIVTVQVAEKNGRFSYDNIIVNVYDPNAMYAGEKTLCVSENRDFIGCPTTALRYDNFSEASDKMMNRNGARSYRLLLHSGESFVASKSVSLSRGGPYLVSRYGQGAYPIIQVDDGISIFNTQHVNDFTATELTIRGDYNPTTGRGGAYRAKLLNTFLSSNLTVFRTNSSGIGMHALITGGSNVVLSDNRIRNWHDYGSLSQGFDADKDGTTSAEEYSQKVAYVGNRIEQHPQAVSSTGGKQGSEPRWADHGPLRNAGAYQYVVSQNILTSTTGWSSNGDGHQPALRYNQDGALGHSGVINRNIMEGGFHVVALSTQNTHTEANLGKVMMERNYLKGSDNTIYMVRLSYGDSVVRNNVMEMPDVTDDGKLLPFLRMFELDFGTSTPENLKAAKYVYANTLLQHQSQPVRPEFSFAEKSFNTDNTLTNALNAQLNAVSAQALNIPASTQYIQIDGLTIDRLSSNYSVNNLIKGLFDDFYGNARGEKNTHAGAVN